jgi:hypothetical protein
MNDVSKYLNPPPDDCPRCDGCGGIATDESQSPWWYWDSLPEQSKLAIRLGLVQRKDCPECNGTGKRPQEQSA